MLKGLTSRQSIVLGRVIAHTHIHGCSPTIRELGVLIDVPSLRGGTRHLDALERKGFVRRTPSARTIRVLKDLDGCPVRLRYVREERS